VKIRVPIVIESPRALVDLVRRAKIHGYFYGDVCEVSSRDRLMAVLKQYLADNGLPVDAVDNEDDDGEEGDAFDEAQREWAEAVAYKLWPKGEPVKRTTALRAMATAFGALGFEVNFFTVSVYFGLGAGEAASEFAAAVKAYDTSIVARSEERDGRLHLRLSLG
jgi:hypothetical protein